MAQLQIQLKLMQKYEWFLQQEQILSSFALYGDSNNSKNHLHVLKTCQIAAVQYIQIATVHYRTSVPPSTSSIYFSTL